MSDELTALAERWRAKAKTVAEYDDDRGAAICRPHAEELEATIAAEQDGLLTPAEAAEYAGGTERTLRQWRARDASRTTGRTRGRCTAGETCPAAARGIRPAATTRGPTR